MCGSHVASAFRRKLDLGRIRPPECGSHESPDASPRWTTAGRANRPDPGYRFHEAAARPGEDAGRGAENVHPSARVSPRARARRSEHQGSDRHHVRWQRPDVRARESGLHGRQGSNRRARSRRPHLAVDRHEQRRRVRQGHYLRGQAGVPALRDAVWTEHHPDQGVQRAGAVEVRGHERRRRCGQERVVRHRIRSHRQRRAPGKLDDVGHGQLALHDVQHIPFALDSRWRRQGNLGKHDGRRMGTDAGRRRQAVVPGRIERDSRLLAVPDRLRQHHHP